MKQFLLQAPEEKFDYEEIIRLLKETIQ